jgi:hypothetical protein
MRKPHRAIDADPTGSAHPRPNGSALPGVASLDIGSAITRKHLGVNSSIQNQGVTLHHPALAKMRLAEAPSVGRAGISRGSAG